VLFILLLAFLIGYSILKFKGYEDSAIWGYHEVLSTSVNSEKPTNKKVKVAILDSGISPHDDLKNKIVASYNAIQSDQDPIDDLNHGTAIAGIISSSQKSYIKNMLIHLLTIPRLKRAMISFNLGLFQQIKATLFL